MRLLCHVILSRLPDESVVSTLEDLARQYNEFATASDHILRAPAAESDERSARLLRSIIGARISAVRSPLRSDDPDDELLS